MNINLLFSVCFLGFSPLIFAQNAAPKPGAGSALSAEAKASADKSVNEKTDVDLEINNLKDKNAEKRMSAIEKLGRANNKKASDTLVNEMKKEKNSRIKARIIESLSNARDGTVTIAIENELKTSADQEVRFSAARSLGCVKDGTAVPILIYTFLNENEKMGVRLQAAYALTNYPKDEVFEVFVKALGNPDAEIKNQAIVSLYLGFGWDKQRVLPHIRRMLKDKGTEETAKHYLENLGVKME